MELTVKNSDPRMLFKWFIVAITIFGAFIFSVLMKTSFLLLVAFIFAGIYVLAVFYQPIWGTYAYVFTLGFYALLNLPITTDGLRLSSVLVLVGLGLWISKAILTRKKSLIAKPLSRSLHIFMCLMLFVMVISLVNSRHIGKSIGEIKQYIYVLSAYFLILYTVKDIRQLKMIIIFIVCAGFIASILGIFEGLGHNIYTTLHNKSLFGAPLSRSILWTSENRINGLVGDGDSHGMYMGSIFLFSLYLFISSKSKYYKITLLIVMLAALFNIIGAASRGAVIGFIIALIVFWFLMELRRKWVILCCILSLFLFIGLSTMILIPNLNIERFYNPEVEATKTVRLRTNNIIIGLAMAKDHPIIGNGPDGFMLNYLRYGPRITASSRKIPTKPLNIYIEAIANYGIVGLTLLTLITLIVLKYLITLIKNLKGEDRLLSVVVLSNFCGYSFFMCTTGFFTEQRYWLLIAFAGTLSSVYYRNFKNAKELTS